MNRTLASRLSMIEAAHPERGKIDMSHMSAEQLSVLETIPRPLDVARLTDLQLRTLAAVRIVGIDG